MSEWELTDEERDAVCRGVFCPKCGSHNVKCVGCNPDGMNVNNAFDCQDCPTKWEGY